MLEHSTVPDFFQEETTDALRLQIDWLKAEFGGDNSFVAGLLKTDQATFADWLHFDGELPPGGEDTLRRLWQGEGAVRSRHGARHNCRGARTCYRCGLARGAPDVRDSKRRFAVPVSFEIWSGSRRSGAKP